MSFAGSAPGGHQAPFAPLLGGGGPGPHMPPGGLLGGPGSHMGHMGGFMGDSHAFNPQMWAGSGVPNPQNIGKPPGQGGFTVQSLLPPPRPPGAPPPAAPGGAPGGPDGGPRSPFAPLGGQMPHGGLIA